MPENVTDRQCCHKCHKTVTGKRKLSKCGRCHSITYCGQECQRADWSRHREYCIPVMVTEIPGRGLGLVASKLFKKGEIIFKESAMISVKSNSPDAGHKVFTIEMALALKEQMKNLSDEQKSKFYKLKPKEGYCDQNRIEIGYMANCLDELVILYSYGTYSSKNDLLKLFVNCAFMNHSCAPNATLFAQDLESGNGLEVVASKDIAKGEEISHCFIQGTNFVSQHEMKLSLQKKYRIDCNCTICSGEIPNQDEIRSELAPIMNSLPQIRYKETGWRTNWRVNVSRLERAVDLTKQLYVGDVFNRFQTLVDLVVAAQLAREPALMGKAIDTLKDQVAVFEGRFKEFGDLMKAVDRWSAHFKLKSPPSKYEVESFLQLSSDVTE